MKTDACIIDKYYSTLSKLGYINYDTVFHILEYLALKDLLHSWEWDAEHKKIINDFINCLENKECIISSCTTCPPSKAKCVGYTAPTFGFYDIPDSVYSNALLEEIRKVMEEGEFFLVV